MVKRGKPFARAKSNNVRPWKRLPARKRPAVVVAVSYSPQPAGALKDLLLALGLGQSSLSFFFKQCREDQQWIGRHPGKRGRFAGCPAQVEIACRLGRGLQSLEEQLSFELFELSLLSSLRWRRRRRLEFESRLRRESGWDPFIVFVHVFTFRFWLPVWPAFFQQKTRD